MGSDEMETPGDGAPLYWARLRATDEEPTVGVDVRDTHSLALDEPPWSAIGEDRAPCPIDYLIVGVAGCQLEVLRHCLERSRVDDYEVDASVEAVLETPGSAEDGIPEPGTNRLTAIEIELSVTTTRAFERRAERCLDIAERVCIVTRSVREGVDVPVEASVTVREE